MAHEREGPGRRIGRGATPRRGCLGRLTVALVLLVLVAAVGSLVAYTYYKARGKDPFGEFSSGFDRLADRLGNRKAAEEVRELGEFIEKRGPEIEKYRDEVDDMLADIREVSVEAYKAAKGKIDEYLAEREEETKEEKADGEAQGQTEE